MKYWMLFVLVTVLCWGAYVPTLHKGQVALGKDSALRAFLFVGAAYFFVSVGVLGYLIFTKAEPTTFTGWGIGLSSIAGVLGAVGALGIVFALKHHPGAGPLIIPPLVFAGAPVVNTIVAMILKPPSRAPSMMFYFGILLAASGVFLALRYKPT